MFDGIMNAAKNSVPMMVMFFVAGLVGMILWTVINGGMEFNFMEILKFAVSAALAGLTTSLVFGAAK